MLKAQCSHLDRMENGQMFWRNQDISTREGTWRGASAPFWSTSHCWSGRVALAFSKLCNETFLHLIVIEKTPATTKRHNPALPCFLLITAQAPSRHFFRFKATECSLHTNAIAILERNLNFSFAPEFAVLNMCSVSWTASNLDCISSASWSTV